VTTPVQPRCHLHLPITDNAGNVFPYASITLNDADTGAPVATNVYVQPEDGNPVSFPLFVDPAIVDIWTDDPVRVQIVAEVSDNVRIVLDGIDILPPAGHIFRSPKRLAVDGADTTVNTAVLMASEPGRATFRVADPVGTHEHEGDSAGSVVLTGEAPTDFNPYQTWVGYHAGENAAGSSTASSAYGAHAELSGASSTVLGIAGIVPQPSTGTSGDMATVLSSEDGDATAGSTVLGPGNLTAQGRDMTVLGGLSSPSSPSSVPNGATVIGPGNVVGTAGSVKIGPNHPASTAGANHVAVGSGNTALNNGLPWAGTQGPFVVGGSQVTLAGDPSDQASSDDWFGGVGPLAMGTSATTWSPSIGLIQGNMCTQTALRVVGDVVVNGQRTYSGTTTTLGFFGKTGVVRPDIPVDPTAVPNTVVDQLLTTLSRLGLIYTTAVPVLTESGQHPDGTPLEFAETGQALQWKLPPASPDYRAANPFTIASNRVVLNAALAPFPSNGVPALYSVGRANVSVKGTFTYSGTASDDNVTGLMIRCLHEKSVSGGQTIATTKGYLVGRTAVYSMSGNTITGTVATHSTPVASGQVLQADCNGGSVTVRANGTQISAFTDSTWNTRVKFGYRLAPTTSVSTFLVLPFGF
jgi:hypothetical protein